MKVRGNLGLLRDEENNFFPGMNTPSPEKFIGHVQGILISSRRIGYIICFALILFIIYFVWFSPLVMEHSPGLKNCQVTIHILHTVLITWLLYNYTMNYFTYLFFWYIYLSATYIWAWVWILCFFIYLFCLFHYLLCLDDMSTC